MKILQDMFRTPEAQQDPHHWVATFAGHFVVCLGIWGWVATVLDMWTAAVIVPIAYLAIWEGGQLYFAAKRRRALVWDSVLDATGVAFGCCSAAALGNGQIVLAQSFWSAFMVVGAVGYKVRMK